jgi:hypothetical protein
VVFVAGVLWKRVTNKSALWTLLLSFPMLILPYLLRIFEVQMNVFNVAGLVLIGTILFLVLTSLLTKPSTTQEGQDYIWKFSMRHLPSELVAEGYPWTKSILFWTLVMVGIYITIYAIFW